MRKTVVLEDTVMVKGAACTAGSEILRGFIAPFDACAAEKLKAGGYAIETCAPPEFGLGDPRAETGICSAVKAVKDEGKCALINDVWGIARRQAADCGLVYLYPSYGRVSRYGLVQYACSMDQIGVLAQGAADAFGILQAVSGGDERDGMSIKVDAYRMTDGKRKIKAGGFKTTLPLTETFGVLAAAEFANNISRYDGVKFGYRAPSFKNINDLYVKTRTEGLGYGAKLYAILGNIVLSQEYYQNYYNKAMRIRRLIRDALDKAFGDFDVLEISPGAAGAPCMDGCLAVSPLTGCPSLTFARNGAPVVAVARRMDEDALYAYAASQL